MNSSKSRNIPLTSYYSNLQLEWLSYYIRSKIYRKDFADNYSQICAGKKEKILGISNKNLLPSIFSNKQILDKYLEELIPCFGTPNFQYKNKEVETKMKRWDVFYYFCKGTSIKFIDQEENIKTGVITKNDKNSEVLEVECNENKQRYFLHYTKASRIFSEEFFRI